MIGLGAVVTRTAATAYAASATALPAARACFRVAVGATRLAVASTVLRPVGAAVLTALGATVLTAIWATVLTAIWTARCGFRSLEFSSRVFRTRTRLAIVAGLALAATAAIAGRLDTVEVSGVFLLLFEKIGDVEESVAFESDFDEGGLHAGEDAGDAALVDRAG